MSTPLPRRVFRDSVEEGGLPRPFGVNPIDVAPIRWARGSNPSSSRRFGTSFLGDGVALSLGSLCLGSSCRSAGSWVTQIEPPQPSRKSATGGPKKMGGVVRRAGLQKHPTNVDEK